MGTTALKADERVESVEIDQQHLTVGLMDGRRISVPLEWYPRLANADPQQLERWEICGAGFGLHWEGLDEDISTEGLLRGAPAPKGKASADLHAWISDGRQ